MARKKFVVCPECNGKGRVYNDETTVGKLAREGLAVTGSVESEKCSKCGGLGKISAEKGSKK